MAFGDTGEDYREATARAPALGRRTAKIVTNLLDYPTGRLSERVDRGVVPSDIASAAQASQAKDQALSHLKAGSSGGV